MGFSNYCAAGYPGMGGWAASNPLLQYLNVQKPQYVIWAIGMNNPDDEEKVNSTWREATDWFLATAKNNKFEPILCTIPNVRGGAVTDTNITGTRIHTYKNSWIKNSGYRYIDMYKAVGADSYGAWYAGMLSSDQVHPTELGAKALASQVIADFPEIMID